MPATIPTYRMTIYGGVDRHEGNSCTEETRGRGEEREREREREKKGREQKVK
jgi:hypothetical protein